MQKRSTTVMTANPTAINGGGGTSHDEEPRAAERELRNIQGTLLTTAQSSLLWCETQ